MAKQMDLSKLIPDDHNFNMGTKEGGALLEKSLRELGAGRSILLDKDNRIISGNKTVEQAMKVGLKKVRIIDSEGDEIIAVRRKDVSLDDKKGRDLAAADNRVSEVNLKWDEEELKKASSAFDGFKASDWGIDLKQVEQDSGFGNLPPELAGRDLNPDAQPVIEGDDNVPYDRIIICFPRNEAEKWAKRFGLEYFQKVVYNVSELFGDDNENAEE